VNEPGIQLSSSSTTTWTICSSLASRTLPPSFHMRNGLYSSCSRQTQCKIPYPFAHHRRNNLRSPSHALTHSALNNAIHPSNSDQPTIMAETSKVRQDRKKRPRCVAPRFHLLKPNSSKDMEISQAWWRHHHCPGWPGGYRHSILRPRRSGLPALRFLSSMLEERLEGS